MGDQVTPDLRIGGKERGLAGNVYPAMCHGLDAAAFCLALWEQHVVPGLRATIARGLGLDEEDAGHTIAHWAGLHDVGKVDPYFQTGRLKLSLLSGYPGPKNAVRGHARLSCEWLALALPSWGYPPPNSEEPLSRLVAQLLGGHHGRYPRSPEPRYDARAEFELDDDAWDEQRVAYARAVGHVLGEPPPPPSLDAPTAVLITGLVVLSDWLASQEHFIKGQLQELPATGRREDLVAHFERSFDAAPRLIEDAGLGRLHVPPADFSDSFPEIETPFPLQASIADHLPELVQGPGLLIVTAPTGEGKTETGLFAADVMGQACGRPGRAFLMPTMATANSMHRRVKDYAARRAESPAPLMKLHSMAWLDQEHLPPTPGEVSRVLSGAPSTRGFEPTEWLYGGLRGLLASWGVGTFDQAFMGVLPSRFNAVRLFGLAGKTVVVDEAHAVDPYMQGELEKLLRWLGRFDVPVVLLSATLHRSVADSYARAYLQGAGAVPRSRLKRREKPVIESLAYPGWVYVTSDSVRPRVVRNPERIGSTPRPPLSVSVETVPMEDRPRQAGGRRADRREALRRLLTPILEDGGCAAVICTTVAEAQQTYDLVRTLIDEAGSGAESHLLHARFPQWQRDEITDGITWRFGKGAIRNGDRPRSAIVVATAIIEQSLDIDVDLMITDLAPMALLLQRAGRCWRHEHLKAIDRYGHAEPRLAVLVPEDPDADAVPDGWAAVYAPSLLERTHRLLRRHGGEVRIPEDVQDLVESVHDDPELASNVKREYERIAETLAQKQEAERLTISAPSGLERRADLEPMTALDFSDEEVATRLGADAVRVLCAFQDDQGNLWCDAGRTERLPGTEPGRGLDLSGAEARAVMGLTIPVRGGEWYRNLAREDRKVPRPWRRWRPLKELIILRHRLTASGHWESASVGGRRWRLDDERGLLVEL